MRILKINDTIVDIDDKTAIGLTLQAYDVKEPGKRKVTVSNTFTIPRTSNNLAIIGFADDPQTESSNVYNDFLCDYWIDNEQVIKNARIRVQESQERISLFIYSNKDFWDDLKDYTWQEFVPEFLAWLQDEKSYPSESDPIIDSFATFIAPYLASTSGLILPMYFGNLYNHVFNDIGGNKSFAFSESQTQFTLVADFTWRLTNWDSSGSNNITSFTINTGAPSYPYLIEKGETYVFDIVKSTPGESADLSFFGENVWLEDKDNIWLKYYPPENDAPANGGHFCTYVKTIFEFLESKFSINLCVLETGITGNIWDDTYAKAIYIPVRDIDVLFHYDILGDIDGFYFSIIASGEFTPEEGVIDKEDKTMYEFVNSFFQHFNIIKDDIILSDGSAAIRLARFDDIVTSAEIVKFSGRIQGIPRFKPFVDGYSQKSFIKFGSVYPEGSDYANSKYITCQNKSLDKEIDLFTIDAYVPAFIAVTAWDVPDLSIVDSFKTFVFLITSATITPTININISHDSETVTAVAQLKEPSLYNLASEYALLNAAMLKPKFYEIEKWLTLAEIQSIEFWRMYYIQELNGSFFINKISGYNPEKSLSPTKIEVIKISNKCLIDEMILTYFTDGLSNVFTDGLGNKFY